MPKLTELLGPMGHVRIWCIWHLTSRHTISNLAVSTYLDLVTFDTFGLACLILWCLEPVQVEGYLTTVHAYKPTQHHLAVRVYVLTYSPYTQPPASVPDRRGYSRIPPCERACLHTWLFLYYPNCCPPACTHMR